MQFFLLIWCVSFNSTTEIVLINAPSSHIPRIIILLSVKHFIRHLTNAQCEEIMQCRRKPNRNGCLQILTNSTLEQI